MILNCFIYYFFRLDHSIASAILNFLCDILVVLNSELFYRKTPGRMTNVINVNTVVGLLIYKLILNESRNKHRLIKNKNLHI